MSKLNTSRFVLLVLALAWPTAGATQEAQGTEGAQAAQDAAPPERSIGIEEIEITARYTKESVQDSPLAVSAFDASAIDAIVATEIQDVAALSPNVHIQPVVTYPNSAAIHIRGIGIQGIESTEEPSAGISIDGVFITRPVASMIDMFDIALVEVLRGPQGSRFGKNSLAGGLRVETVRPSGELGAKGEFNIGNFGRRDVRVAVDSPTFADQLAFRLAYFHEGYDGHFKNRANGKHLNGENQEALRAQALWTPIESFDLRLVFGLVRDRSDAPGGEADNDPDQVMCLFLGWCSEPDSDPFRVGRDAPGFHNLDQESYTAIANYSFGDFTLTSITGYIDTDDRTANDFDQTEVVFFPTTRDQIHDQVSQEIRLATDFENSGGVLGRSGLVLGYFFLRQEHELTQNFPTLGPSADYTTQEATSHGVFAQAILGITDDLNASLGVRYSREEKDFFRDPGSFAPTITLDPATHLRVPDARRVARAKQAAGGAVVEGDFETDNWSVDVGLDYHFTEELMAYFRFAQGFKAGGFGARASTLATAGPVGDETSDSFELGLKSRWWDDRLVLNLAAFHATYDDLQFAVFVSSPSNPTGQETSFQNLGKATVQGIELDLAAQLHELLRVDANVGWLDAEYDKFCADLDGPYGFATPPTAECGSITAVGDIGINLPGGRFLNPFAPGVPDGLPDYLVPTDNSDGELSRAPEWNAHMDAELAIPIGRFGELAWRTDWHYESHYFSDGVLNHPKARTGDVSWFDSNVTWWSPERTFRVMIWGKNLGDREVVAGLTPTAAFFNQKFWFPPRTYGITGTVFWGAK